MVGGLAGATIERATGATVTFECITRGPNGQPACATRRNAAPPLGREVMVTAGAQARGIPDYTVARTQKSYQARMPHQV